MGKKKSDGKRKKNRDQDKLELKDWDELRREHPVDERKVAAYGRLMSAEQRLYEVWEKRAKNMNWIGEAMAWEVEEGAGLWVTRLGEKVAALGGNLELVAVSPDESVTLLIEPGPARPSKKSE